MASAPRVEMPAGRKAFTEHEGFLRHARGLLHRMGNNDDGIAALQLVYQFFDPRGGDGV